MNPTRKNLLQFPLSQNNSSKSSETITTDEGNECNGELIAKEVLEEKRQVRELGKVEDLKFEVISYIQDENTAVEQLVDLVCWVRYLRSRNREVKEEVVKS